MERSVLAFTGLVLTGALAVCFVRTTAAEPAAVAAPQPAADDRPQPLAEDGSVVLDRKKGELLVKAKVCLREGMLEMFACLKGTKEHESIVAAPVKAQLVHAGLLALGAKPGHPAQFIPEYRPAEGDRIQIGVRWTDEEGKAHEARAQDWIREVKSKRAMQGDWVFGGSGFWVDDRTGERLYQAEEGDLVCISNFPTAMLDLPIESSQDNAALLFEAFSERIPPKGTEVTLVFSLPAREKQPAGAEQPEAPKKSR
jgi:hypothetical protein